MAQTHGPGTAAVDGQNPSTAQPHEPHEPHRRHHRAHDAHEQEARERDLHSAGASTAPAGEGTAAAGEGTAAAGTPGDRVAALEAALEAAKAEARENWERFLRERAEMENYKKRVERTYADLAKRGRKDLLVKILGVLDNLERAIAYEAQPGREVDARNLLKGVQLTHQQFRDLLRAEGLKEVKSVGEQFDPAVHEAVTTEVTADKPEGQIVDELQKGYLYDEELLRPARVRVATRG